MMKPSVMSRRLRPWQVMRAAAGVLVALVLVTGVLAQPATADSAFNVRYQGGNAGVGVMTGHEKVYLVFWGSQWGTPTTDSNRNTVFPNDPSGAAPVEQQFFKGLGGSGDTWSSVMTQYCEGVPARTQLCSSGAAHVGFPASSALAGRTGALAGLWADDGAPAPQQAALSDFGKEARSAAAHFGNLTAADNHDSVYVLLSPPGTHPDGFNTTGVKFCAEHSWESLSPGPDAFVNMPYVTDKSGCRAKWNTVTGAVGAFTTALSHEYAETITNPTGGGWTGGAGITGGAGEIGDLCNLKSFPLQLSTGLFWAQSVWSNTANNGTGGCIGQDPGSGVLNGGFENGTYGWASTGDVANTVNAHSGSSALYLAPAGASSDSLAAQNFNVPTGDNWLSFWFKQHCLHGTGSYVTVTLQDITGSGNGQAVPFTSPLPQTCAATAQWTLVVAPVTPGHLYNLGFDNYNSNSDTSIDDVRLTAVEPSAINNGSFQYGTLWYWNTTGTTSVASAGGGTAAAQLGATTPTNGDSSISQTFTAPYGQTTLSFDYKMFSPQYQDGVNFDWATATLTDTTTNTTNTILPQTYAYNPDWSHVTGTITPGDSYTLTLTNHDDGSDGDPTYTWYTNIATS